jgi:hypothetical protein
MRCNGKNKYGLLTKQVHYEFTITGPVLAVPASPPLPRSSSGSMMPIENNQKGVSPFGLVECY